MVRGTLTRTASLPTLRRLSALAGAGTEPRLVLSVGESFVRPSLLLL